MSLEHCSDETQCNSSSPCESSKIDNISEINEERRDTCIWTTSNPIKSDNNCQFTKLAKQKSRVKDVQADSAIQAHPDDDQHKSYILKYKRDEPYNE